MEKSHVGMGYEICPICHKEHTETVLLDKMLKNTLTNHMFTGFSLCEEHLKLYKDGYIALVAFDESKSKRPINIENAYLTGHTAHIKKEAYQKIFNEKLPENQFNICFCDNETLDRLATIPIQE